MAQAQNKDRVVTAPDGYKTAIFAGGCFWCMEYPFERLSAVKNVISGYTGGDVENPSYKDVSRGETGHYEAVMVIYDPDRVDYETLLEIFWRNIDPFDDGGQFCDKGGQYKAAIFAQDKAERKQAEDSKANMQKRFEGQEIVTDILPAQTFYAAEDYHQDYYKKNKWRYKFYRGGCGRDKRLGQIWGEEAGGYHIKEPVKEPVKKQQN